MPISGLPGGDFSNCVKAMAGKMDNPEAFCAWKTHELTGKWPSEEALTALQSSAPTQTESIHEGLTLRLEEAQLNDAGMLSGIVMREGLSGNGKNVYTVEALNSIPTVFADAPIFINHTTNSESRERPEGNLVNLVGRLSADPGDFVLEQRDGATMCRFKNAVITGEPPYIQERIRRGIWRDMSISASGEGMEQRDGTFKVTRFVKHPYTSLDLVTVGAAGGRAELQESIISDNGGVMNKQEEITKLEQRLAELRGPDAIQSALEESKLAPEFWPTVRRLVESITAADEAEAEPDKEEPAMSEAVMEGVPMEAEGLPEEVQSVWLDTYNASQAAGDEPGTRVHKAWRAVVDMLLAATGEGEAEMETAVAQAAAEAFRAGLAQSGKKRDLGAGKPEAGATVDADARLASAFKAWGVNDAERLVKEVL